MLSGKVALVTGASRGIGRGIALQLGEAGATVYVTGREPKSSESNKLDGLPTLEITAEDVTKRGGKGIALYCDHGNSDDVKKLFETIESQTEGRLDILVNNAYSAVNALLENAGKKFWELDPLFWDTVNNVGLRNHYICSVYAAKMMVRQKDGLIVTVSSGGGLRYLFNVAYGVGKCACDRLAADMAHELRRHNVCSISLWPGAVRTETIMGNMEQNKSLSVSEAQMDVNEMFKNGETIEYAGRGVAHLAADPNKLNRTGKIVISGDLADQYGFVDVDGRKPPNMRTVKSAMQFYKWERLSTWVPEWLKMPGWMITASASKL